MVSRYTLSKLPDVEQLRSLTQSLAMLDAILCPEWEFRYSSFNSRWAEREMMASLRNGSGDDYFILFNQGGAIIKGFDHESEMSPYANDDTLWPGVLDDVPAEFSGFLSEPAFMINDSTFCLWRLMKDDEWQAGQISYPENDEEADGSDWLLFLLDDNPETYRKWAQDYYETDVNPSAVEQIYRHLPLAEEMIFSLNPELTLADLIEDIEEIGYP